MAIALVSALGVGGVLRFDHLATRPMDPAEFSWFNKAEIYTGYVAMMVAGYPMYPEISKEMWFMVSPQTHYRVTPPCKDSNLIQRVLQKEPME